MLFTVFVSEKIMLSLKYYRSIEFVAVTHFREFRLVNHIRSPGIKMVEW